MANAKHLKGVHNMNPTKAVMKLGSKQAREAQKMPAKTRNETAMPEAHETSADVANTGSARMSKKASGESHVSDFYGVENQTHHTEHPAMKTRASHPANHKHADGRKHEEHHHAVKMAKGK